MGIARECDCSPSLAEALGAFAGYGELTPARPSGALMYCLWCGEPVVEPELLDAELPRA